MRSTPLPTRPALAVLAVLALPLLAACTESTDTAGDGAAGGAARTVAVTSSEDACELSATEAPSGTLRFDVSNAGSQVTEFYLLDAEGLAIKGEAENVGPASSC